MCICGRIFVRYGIRSVYVYDVHMSSLLNAESVRTKKCWKIRAICNT